MTSEAGSDPCVWVCTTLNSSRYVDAIIRKESTPQWREQQSPERVEWSKRMVQEKERGWKRGEILSAEQVGDIYYFNTRPEFKTAPFLNGGGTPMVSETLVLELEKSDLGETIFHPITLMDSEETHLTTRESYFILNVGNKRSMGNYQALGPKGDIRSPLNCINDGVIYLPRIGKEEELVVSPEALGGPDIWLDPMVPGIFFLSDHLANGLKQAGLDKSLRLVRCAVSVL